MIENIRETFLNTLNENPWMDSATKANASEKARHFRFRYHNKPITGRSSLTG